ncbi:MAG: fibronectin type III domain-containing protein, partial [Actinobacteria bacterium]|nr:fibronectin type III domain-containing protein [Actinomycetota bacterium]
AEQAASGSTERVGCSIHGLVQGSIYYLEVGATTDYGLASTPTRTAVRVRPGMPLPVRAVEGFPADHRIKVTWQLPASDGGQPITLYRVQAWSKAVDGRLTNTCTARANAVDSEFTCTIIVADNFEPYWVEVAAQTTRGWGQSSARVNLEANPAVPPAPERVELAPRDADVRRTRGLFHLLNNDFEKAPIRMWRARTTPPRAGHNSASAP